jgi:hypothetical protein
LEPGEEQGLKALFEEGDPAYIEMDGRPGFYDANGIARFPGCSEGPTPLFGPSGEPLGTPVVASDGSFQFFVDLGPDGVLGGDLLIYFSGGGACWDSATCVGSALTPASTYFPATTESAEVLNLAASADASGILAARSDNPYAGFDKIYIPYCTGDVHIGSSDTVYDYPPLLNFGAAASEWTIRHRGYDNLLAVLKWLEKQLDGDNPGALDEISVAGSSAGGYAALLNFPVVREALDALALSDSGTDYSIIVDSSNGVLTDGFLDRAFGVPGADGAWGIWEGGTIAPVLQTVLAGAGADSLWVESFDAVGGEYRDTRISQSTAAYDLVQSIVLLNMKKVDDGTYNPFVPPNELEVTLTSLFDWSPKARVSMLTTAFMVPNYRYYLGAGQGHIHLIDPPPELFPFPTTNYFAENSARGVFYTDWLDDMLNNPRRFFGTDWKSLSCFPGCLE